MLDRWRPMLGTAFVAMAVPALLYAQGRGAGGAMPQAAGYDKSKEVTVTGTVSEVTEQQPMMQGQRGGGNMGMGGVHLVFKTADGEALDVRLGPKSWLDEHHYTFSAGDELTIIGSKTTMHDMATMTDKVALIAREITKGGETMTLRDENGRPAWAGQMMRNR